MYIIRILGNETTIDLGRRGENRALAIDFPIDNFIANYGAGMASLAHLRPGDTEPYICGTETVVSDGATYLRWVVTDTDTAKAGSGRCELRWNVDDTGDGDPIDDYDTRAKSIIYTTTVHPSLTDETQIPDPYKDWYDTMMAALAPAIDAADSPALKLLNGGVKTTSSSTNLNSFKYVTEGVYYHDGSVTLTNAPVSGQFVMIVREQPMQQNPNDTEYTLSWFTRVIVTLGSAPQVWIQCGQLYRPFTHPPTFFTWRKIPSASDITSIESDLDTLTTTVTANTAKIDIVTGSNTIKTLTASDDLATLADGHYRLSSAVPLNAPSGLASSSKYGYVTIQHRGAAGYTYYEYVAGNGDGTTLERHFGWKSTTAGTTITWEA